MKDKLEDFIRRNRAEMDGEEVPAGLWNKIASDLDEEPEGKGIIRLRSYIVWSAAALLLLSVATIFYQASLLREQHTQQGLASIEDTTDSTAEKSTYPSELQILEAAYQKEYSHTIGILENFPEEKQEILTELNELNREFESLKQELGQGYSNRDVLEALVENYRIKLELLEQTIEHIKRSNKISEDEEVDYL